MNVGVPTYECVDVVDKVELLPNTIQALGKLAKLDYGVFFITNQGGLGEGSMSYDDFEEVNDRVLELIAPSGVNILKTYLCPHGKDGGCDCRKPQPKLLHDAAEEFAIDLSQSWTIGDRVSDVMTGVRAGTRTILVKTGIATVESEHATYTAPSLLEAIDFIARN